MKLVRVGQFEVNPEQIRYVEDVDEYLRLIHFGPEDEITVTKDEWEAASEEIEA